MSSRRQQQQHGCGGAVVFLSRPKPHEAFLFVLALLTGASTVWGAPPAPGSVEAALPFTAVLVWGVVLLLGGIVGMLGYLWRGNKILGLELERGSLMLLSGVGVYYILALAAWGGMDGMGQAILVGMWTVANLWEAWLIGRDLRAIQEVP